MKAVRSRRFLWIAIAVVGVAIVAGAVVWTYSRRLRQAVLPVGTVEFYGLVVDDEGHPVSGAAVDIYLTESKHRDSEVIAPYEEMVDGRKETVEVGAADPGYAYKSRVFNLTTDASGRFSLRRPGMSIRVLTIRKPDHEWLIDLVWDSMNAGYLDHHCPFNYGYFFAEDPIFQKYWPDTKIPIYLPDPARPAIFPMIRPGATKAPAPSRGGADRFPDGRIVQNGPLQLLVPSTGPAYIHNNAEREKKLRDFAVALQNELIRRAATRPAKGIQ